MKIIQSITGKKTLINNFVNSTRIYKHFANNNPIIKIQLKFEKKLLKLTLDNHFHDIWSQDFQNQQGLRQSKLWFSEPNYQISKKKLSLKRVDFGVLIQWSWVVA